MAQDNMAAFIWSVADLLRGDFKQSQYGRVILPFTLLRRLESVLEPTKGAVQAAADRHKNLADEARHKLLLHAAGQPFYNTSQIDLNKLGTTQVLDNLDSYVQAFSPQSREIFEHFNFGTFLVRLHDANLLYKVAKRFAGMDLSPGKLSNHDMGLVFEELIRRFAESSNETAGEHFTPRDVVRLTTSLVFSMDDAVLTQPGVVRSIYDPTAGTGGFLSSGMEYVEELNPNARLAAFGQELNPESYAICMADMLIKGEDVAHIKQGNTLSDDKLPDKRFDYMLSNPPFGVDWKKVQKQINDEHVLKGFGGRFGPGLPRVSDGSLLFLMHLISKMRPPEGEAAGSRIGIILNGSPLFTGGAGSGESEIRRYVLENDLLEAIIALPTDMFYNTGIATYVWVLSNHKPAERKSKVQLINATEAYGRMRKSLGSKRKQLSEVQIEAIVRLYGRFEEADEFEETGESDASGQPVRKKVLSSKIFDTTDFGYRRITVERPLQLRFEVTQARLDTYVDEYLQKINKKRKKGEPEVTVDAMPPPAWDVLQKLREQPPWLSRSKFFKALVSTDKLGAADKKLIQKHFGEPDEKAEICTVKAKPEPNPDLRDNENVPLAESVDAYFKREVLPHVPTAWIDEAKRDGKDGKVGIVGYEIPFNRHFFEYVPPRSLEKIDADLDRVSAEIVALLQAVHS